MAFFWLPIPQVGVFGFGDFRSVLGGGFVAFWFVEYWEVLEGMTWGFLNLLSGCRIVWINCEVQKCGALETGGEDHGAGCQWGD